MKPVDLDYVQRLCEERGIGGGCRDCGHQDTEKHSWEECIERLARLVDLVPQMAAEIAELRSALQDAIETVKGEGYSDDVWGPWTMALVEEKKR